MRGARPAGGALLGAAAIALWLASAPGPPASDLAAVRARFESSEGVLLDRRGALLHESRVDFHGRRLAWTELAAIAPALRESVVRAEDRRFFRHRGVDLRALGGSLFGLLRGGPRRGASTLSMQLAALLDPALRAGPPPLGLLAKLRQMRAARALESRLAKDEILEAYLNLASFRGELQGVAAASHGLFDRAPHGLGAAEAALLAALLPAPNAPPEVVAARGCRIAAQRGEASCDAVRALAQRALAAAPRVRAAARLAPHLAARLLRPLAPGEAQARRVATTLDARLQVLVADVLRRQVSELRGRNARDAAALVADNASGEILAWVGGVGELGSAAHVDGVRARRQAGSTLKPFLYARALDRRLVTASSRLDDSPLDLVTPLGSYRPENYDRAFRGLVPAREALAASLNVPAVRLLELVGTADFVGRLRALGFAGLREPELYGGSLALGSADVTLLELVAAYRTLAAGGRYTPLRVEPGAPEPAVDGAEPVFSPAAAFVVADVLADRASRAGGFGLESPLGARVWSAAKTGTSKDLRDNWCLGFTSRYSVGVWLGNFSGESMWDVSGVDGAAPAWLSIVHALHEALPSEAPEPPDGVVRAGGEWYLAGTEPAALAAAPLTAAEARIVAPADGLVLALDPDIPDARERVLLDIAPRDASLSYHLDARPLASAGAPHLWPPTRGRHALTLVAPDGRTLHRIHFEVR